MTDTPSSHFSRDPDDLHRSAAPGSCQPTQVLLLDSHWITRTALHTALASADDVEIVAVAANCDEVIATVSAGGLEPDVLVHTDAADPAVLLPRLVSVLPRWPLRVLMIGGEGFPSSLNCCVTAGWLPQSATEQQFVSAVRLVAAGHWIFPSPLDPCAIAAPSETSGPLSAHGLTVREQEVLRLLGHGYTNAEISLYLQLGQSTVKSHVQNVFNKIGARNRVRAAIYAYEIGLLHPRDLGAATRANHNPNPVA